MNALSPTICEPDVLHSLWAPVTVRVAWELWLAGVRVRPAVLGDAREHVLRSLQPGTDPHDIDVLVRIHTREYLRRIRDHCVKQPELPATLRAPIPPIWHKRLHAALTHQGRVVWARVYGDGLSLQQTAQMAEMDIAETQAAQDGIRALLVQISHEVPGPLHGDHPTEIDTLLQRLATTTHGRCPTGTSLLTPQGHQHAAKCGQCSRAVRLLQQGIIAPTDLQPQPISTERVTVMALQLHPDGQGHTKHLKPVVHDGVVIGQDCWLIDAHSPDTLAQALSLLCESATPPRYHLRGAVVSGPGRWSRGTVLGPLPLVALGHARHTLWSEIEGLGELPPPLPNPPRPVGIWAVALLLSTLAGAAGWWALRPRVAPPVYPIEANVQASVDTLDLRFDLHDLGVMDLVLLRPDGTVEVAARSLRQEKGTWATGQGDFALTAHATGAAIISSVEGIDDLELLVAAASNTPNPLHDLKRRVQTRHPTADVWTTPVVHRQTDG